MNFTFVYRFRTLMLMFLSSPYPWKSLSMSFWRQSWPRFPRKSLGMMTPLEMTLCDVCSCVDNYQELRVWMETDKINRTRISCSVGAPAAGSSSPTVAVVRLCVVLCYHRWRQQLSCPNKHTWMSNIITIIKTPFVIFLIGGRNLCFLSSAYASSSSYNIFLLFCYNSSVKQPI